MKINLLPPEVKERHRSRQRTMAVLLVGLIILAALGVFYFLQVVRLARVEANLAAQREVNARLEQEISELRAFDELDRQVRESEALLATLLQDEVLWSGLLRDISLVIPGSTWLTTLNGGIAGAEGEGVDATAGGLAGQIAIGGFGFDHRSVALWLTRLDDVEGFTNPWLADASKTLIGEREVVQFESSVDLSPAARVDSREAP